MQIRFKRKKTCPNETIAIICVVHQVKDILSVSSSQIAPWNAIPNLPQVIESVYRITCASRYKGKNHMIISCCIRHAVQLHRWEMQFHLNIVTYVALHSSQKCSECHNYCHSGAFKSERISALQHIFKQFYALLGGFHAANKAKSICFWCTYISQFVINAAIMTLAKHIRNKTL